jgi:hypothetical protein
MGRPRRLSPRDIVDMLKETLPRKPEGKEALVAASMLVASAGETQSSPASETPKNLNLHR